MRGISLWFALSALTGLPLWAEERPASNCLALAAGESVLMPAEFRPPGPAEAQSATLTIRFLGHASFALMAGDVLAVTDYTGVIGNPDLVPDLVTMNNAHASHYTDTPDPRIPHVLRGWGPPGDPPMINRDIGAMAVRNVTTDLRGPFGEGARADGNSIFLFEAAGLCVAHLGHLHQIPDAAQYAAIGRVDVVMVPVDGNFTMDQAAVAEVLARLDAPLVLPMHWFDGAGLRRFLALTGPTHRIRVSGGPEITLSRASLPDVPTVLVLPPALFP